MKELVIIGAGQYGQNVRDIVMSNGSYDTISFADDKSSIARYTIEEAINLNGVDLFVAIGNPQIRESICHQLKEKCKNAVSIIHRSAYVAKSAKIGKGCIVEPGAIINANVEIAEGTFICAGAIINHNSKIGSYAQIDVGVIIPSNKDIKDYTKVEVGD